MAEKKIIGEAYNLIKFKTDQASLQKALKDIKRVKEEMQKIQGTPQKVRTQAAQKQQTTKKQTQADKDWLIVQRQINKNNKEKLKQESAMLKNQERGIKNTDRQTRALQKQQATARKSALSGLTAGSGLKANSTLFAQMLRQEEAYNKRRDDVLSRRDSARLNRRIRRQAQIDRLHGQALAENARRTNASNRAGLASATRQADMMSADRFGLTNRFGNRAGGRFDAIAAEFRNGNMSARMYRQQVSALRRDLSAAANAQRGFNGTLRDMRSMVIQATASYTAFAAISGIADIGKKRESRQAGMLVATGSKEAAAQQSQFLNYQTRRLGLDYNVASQGYVQLGVAGAGSMSQGDINKTFTGLSELGTAVQLDPMRYEKAILAISQMMNKGQIMAEELKSQLTP